MSFSMQSKTKITLSKEKLNQISEYHFKEKPMEMVEVTSGFYNVIFELIYEDRSRIIKVAPSADIDVMTYEKEIMKREVLVYEYMRSLEIPVPVILAQDFSKQLISSDYYIMEKLDGNTLFELREDVENKTEIYFKVMEYLAKLHTKKMDSFGYDNFTEKVSSNKEAIALMIENIYQDGQQKNIGYDSFIMDLYQEVKKHYDVLDEVQEASLLHFDLWDGNIFIYENNITGLIDTERSFNGEPIAEFAAMHIDVFLEENQKYVKHYNKFTEKKIHLDENTKIRFRIYQFYMYLLIYTECIYRDVEGSFNNQKAWATEMLIYLSQEFKKL